MPTNARRAAAALGAGLAMLPLASSRAASILALAAEPPPQPPRPGGSAR